MTLGAGAQLHGKLTKNGSCAALVRFAGGRAINSTFASNQTGLFVIESIDGSNIVFEERGSSDRLFQCTDSGGFSLRGSGDFVKTGAGTNYVHYLNNNGNGIFDWSLSGNLVIEEGGVIFANDADLGNSCIVATNSAAAKVDFMSGTIRTAGITTHETGSIAVTNTSMLSGGSTIAICGAGDLRNFPCGVNLAVESGANVRLAGPKATGYRHYRLLVTDGVGSERGSIQLSEFSLMDGETDVTRIAGTTYSAGRPADSDYANAFDGNTATKWLDRNGAYNKSVTDQSNVWLQVSYPSPQHITGYRWATADDKPRESEELSATCRDPKAWALLGSTDGVNWIVLDEVRDYPFHKPRCAFTGDIFKPTFAELSISAPRVSVADGGTLALEGAAFAGNTILSAESASVTGALHVASGTVTCRSERIGVYGHKYWKLSIFAARGGDSTVVQASEFALYDKRGNRLNIGLTSAGDAVAAASLAAGQFTSFYGTGSLRCYNPVEKLFDNDIDTNGSKMCSQDKPTSEKPVVIVMRLADDTEPVASYLFASGNDHPDRNLCDWSLEASADGITWTVVDERVNETTTDDLNTYAAYNGGVPYTFAAGESLGGAVLAPGSAVRVDSGAAVSFAAAPTPVSLLEVDGAGAGSVDILAIAANGALHIEGVSKDALSSYTVPLSIGQIVSPGNLDSWGVLLDGVAQRNASVFAAGSMLCIRKKGMVLIVR